MGQGDINKILIYKESVSTQTNGFKLDKVKFRKEIGNN